VWVIGLTGGIGSGKSSVARWLLGKDIPVLDADRIVHDLLSRDEQTIRAVENAFGTEVISPKGEINRRVLGSTVFSDSVARTCLEEILHPRVADQMKKQQVALEAVGRTICVWDVPLLFEAGFNHWVDEVWVVWVPSAIQIERVMIRDALKRKEVELRIKAQLPLEDKVSQANIVIDNSKSWEETEELLSKELARIKREHHL
jgi:dephospho-CoA kinase